MGMDAQEAAAFYATPLGGLTARLLREKLRGLWPDCTGMSVLGIGFAGPYLQLWRAQAVCSIAAFPPAMGSCPWPAGRASLACLADEDALPFPDFSFDRVLLIHGLEQADNARRTLREAWRLLKDDGRIIAVVPNRRGLWAYAESTPFGHGQPYSNGQLARLLSGMFFQVEKQDSALFAPPLAWRINLDLFDAWETAGHAVAPELAGLTIAEARKDLHAVMPIRRRSSGRRVLVDVG